MPRRLGNFFPFDSRRVPPPRCFSIQSRLFGASIFRYESQVVHHIIDEAPTEMLTHWRERAYELFAEGHARYLPFTPLPNAWVSF